MVVSDNPGSVRSQKDPGSAHAPAGPTKAADKAWVVKASGEEAPSKRKRPRLRPRLQRKEQQHQQQQQGAWSAPHAQRREEAQAEGSGEEEYDEEEDDEYGEDLPSTVCVYNRCLLLQFHTLCKSRTTSGASTSCGSSPRSQGSLHTALIEPPTDSKEHTKAASEEKCTIVKDLHKHFETAERPGKQKTATEARIEVDEIKDPNEPVKVEPPLGLLSALAARSKHLLVPKDSPSTVVLWNIPHEYTRTNLCERLAYYDFGYAIDFLYLPIDSKTEQNMGTATINLRTQAVYNEFFKVFHGVPAKDCLPNFPSTNVCEVSFAEVQGLEANIEKLCTPDNMKHWANRDSRQPLFLQDDGTRISLTSARKRSGSSNYGSGTEEPEKPVKSTQLKATSTEFVPNQLNLLLSALVPSPVLRAEAPEFVPSNFSLPEADAPEDVDQSANGVI